MKIMRIEWNAEKNEWLKQNRGICFEQVLAEIKAGRNTAPVTNPAHEHQFLTVIKINGYPYAVPFVITADDGWFLKTAYPCRKMKGRI